jgi:hypothetical protein
MPADNIINVHLGPDLMAWVADHKVRTGVPTAEFVRRLLEDERQYEAETEAAAPATAADIAQEVGKRG